MEQNSATILNSTDRYNSSAFDRHPSLSHCRDFELKQMEIFISVVLYSIIGVGGSLGNTLVLLVIKRTPHLKTACGVLIANLAFADLLVTALAIPIVISVIIPGFVPICTLTASMLPAIIVGRCSCAASLLLLSAMSIDRCWAIGYPFHHKIQMSSSKLKTVLLFIWISSLILPILEVVFHREGLTFSVLVVKKLQRLGVLISYFAIVTSGLVTFITVRCSSSKIANLHNDGSHNRTLAELRERNKQVAKTIALVVVAFSIFWVPIIYIGARFIDHYSLLHFWGVLPGFANSAVNPCIYFYRQRSYRQAFKALLRRSWMITWSVSIYSDGCNVVLRFIQFSFSTKGSVFCLNSSDTWKRYISVLHSWTILVSLWFHMLSREASILALNYQVIFRFPFRICTRFCFNKTPKKYVSVESLTNAV